MIPEGYHIIDYLNTVVLDHSLDYIIHALMQHNSTHCCQFSDIRIANNGSEDSIQLVLIGKPKEKKS